VGLGWAGLAIIQKLWGVAGATDQSEYVPANKTCSLGLRVGGQAAISRCGWGNLVAMQKTTQLQNAKTSTYYVVFHAVESENNEKHQLKWVVGEEWAFEKSIILVGRDGAKLPN
jgi:hypothetical protein